MSVVAKIDIRAMPMSIAENMLSLGSALNMGSGPVAYLEAEFKLEIWLQVLDEYKRLFLYGDSSTIPMTHQKRYVVRFLSLHATNMSLKASQARQLLDNLNYFPATEPAYLENLDADERSGH